MDTNSILNFASYGIGASKILNGIGIIRQSSKIAKYQEKLLNIEKEYNLEKSKTKYQRDFISMTEQYVEQRNKLIKEATTTTSTLNNITATKNNVDKEFNSTRHDSLSALDTEFMQNINKINSEQIFNMRELSEMRNTYDYNLKTNYNNMLSKINSQKNQSQMYGTGQIVSGSIGIAKTLMMGG